MCACDGVWWHPAPSRPEPRPAPRPAPGHNGSITSSSQSSDESEEQTRDNPPLNTARGYRCASAISTYLVDSRYYLHIYISTISRGYRSASLPRHSSVSHYRRSVTMPDIKQTAETSNNSNHHNHFEDRTSNLQLTTWLQSLTGASPQPPSHADTEEWGQILFCPQQWSLH